MPRCKTLSTILMPALLLALAPQVRAQTEIDGLMMEKMPFVWDPCTATAAGKTTGKAPANAKT